MFTLHFRWNIVEILKDECHSNIQNKLADVALTE
jgi:hypothetical protein